MVAANDLLEQRRLAAPVRADERDVLAPLEHEGDVVEKLLPSGLHVGLLHLEHVAAAPLRLGEVEARAAASCA